MTQLPLEAAPLIMSHNFKLSEEDGDMYSDNEYDMPGYYPPRIFVMEMPRCRDLVNVKEDEKNMAAKKNLIDAHKMILDAGAALGLDLCKIYKQNRIEYIISEIGVRQKQCPLFKRTLTKVAGLKSHMNQHLVEPKFMCATCDKGFGEMES